MKNKTGNLLFKAQADKCEIMYEVVCPHCKGNVLLTSSPIIPEELECTCGHNFVGTPECVWYQIRERELWRK